MLIDALKQNFKEAFAMLMQIQTKTKIFCSLALQDFQNFRFVKKSNNVANNSAFFKQKISSTVSRLGTEKEFKRQNEYTHKLFSNMTIRLDGQRKRVALYSNQNLQDGYFKSWLEASSNIATNYG